MKKVSVIVPVYNVEEYLPKCLDSLINQTLKDIEIIVVNDGSPDNSQKIIDEYRKKDKRIISIVKENGGLGSARNIGLEKAKGEYISYVDSDDWIELDMLEQMYAEAKNQNAEIVICSFKNVYDNRSEEVFIDQNLINDTLNQKNNKILNLVSACCKIYKRKFLLESKITFAENIWYEDFAYATKVLAKANNIGFVNEALYNYYIREKSIMHNDNIIKSLDLITAFDDIIDFYRNNDLYDIYYDELEFLAIDHFSYGMARVIKSYGNKKDKKYVLEKYDEYLRKHFDNLKKNKYLCYFSKKKKLIYSLLLKKNYKLVEIIFKLRGNK